MPVFAPGPPFAFPSISSINGSAILPTRRRRPRDEAKVEAADRIVECWLRGRLRHRVFYSLADVNAAIVELLIVLNDRRVLRCVARASALQSGETCKSVPTAVSFTNQSKRARRSVGQLPTVTVELCGTDKFRSPSNLPRSPKKFGGIPTRR